MFVLNEDVLIAAIIEFNNLPAPVALTIENAKNYLKFDQIWENFNFTTSKDFFGFTHYDCMVEYKIICSSMYGESFENVSMKLGIERDTVYGAFFEDLFLVSSGTLSMSLDGSGNGLLIKILTADYPIMPNPSFFLTVEDIYIKEIEGIVYPVK